MANILKDRIGQKFDRLLVLKRIDKHHWLFQCDCGVEKILGSDVFKKNRDRATKSCGCLAKEKRQHHGHKPGAGPSPEYISWLAMKARCTNARNIGWKQYGGKGIKVCGHWLTSFENFLEDMGPRPSKDHTLDRIDNSGPYNSKNCRWATKKEQAKNRNPWMTPRLRAALRVAGKKGALVRWEK